MVAVRTMAIDSDGCAALDKPTRVRVDVRATMVRREQRVGLATAAPRVSTVRTNVLGEGDVQPTADQLRAMELLVNQAMEEGALGVTTMLEYVPEAYGKTPELIALAKESARCGGIYTAHIRNESDRLNDAIQETIDIARASGAPAEIYHTTCTQR